MIIEQFCFHEKHGVYFSFFASDEYFMKVKLECVAIGTKEYSIHHMFDSPKNVEDDIREPLVRIIRNRLPWLILGLF